jgi:hypothetical protein
LAKAQAGLKETEAKLKKVGSTANRWSRQVGSSFDTVRLKAMYMGDGIKKATLQVQKLNKRSYDLRGALIAMAGAAGMGYAAKRTFALGAAVEETASKFNTVFGASTKTVQAFIDEFGVMAGLSNTAAREILATTGAIVQGMGLAERASAAYATQVVELAGDLSSFNNIPIEETARAIQAAITGEREMMKRFGVVILETDVQQRALADTGKTLARTLTQEERAMATLALITERAGVAMGDLVRTQDSSANRARQTAAQFKNLAESLATSLMPALTSALGLINSLVDRSGVWVRRLADGIRFASMELTGINSQFIAVRESILATLGAAGDKEGFLGGRLAKDESELEKVLGSISRLNALLGQAQRMSTRLDLEEKLEQQNDKAELLRLTIGFINDELRRMGREARRASGQAETAFEDMIRAATLGRTGAMTRKGPLPPGAVTANLPFGPATPTETFFQGIGRNLNDIGASIASVFDPKEFFTGLATGGATALLGTITGVIGKAFGPSAEEQRIEAALDRNVGALNNLKRSLDKQAAALAAMPGALFTQVSAAARAAFTGTVPQGIGDIFEGLFLTENVDIKAARNALKQMGLTLDDVRTVAEKAGIQFEDTRRGWAQLSEALRELQLKDLTDTIAGRLDFMQKEFEFRDFKPVKQLQRLRDFFVSNAALGTTGQRLQTLKLETAGGRQQLQTILESVFSQVASGQLDVAALGGFSVNQFVDLLMQMESLGDEVDATTGAFKDLTKELLNVPQGFKLAFHTFSADTGIVPGGTLGGGTIGGGDVVVGNITVVAAPGESAEALWNRMEKEARKEARRGGTTQLDLAVR